MQVSLSVISIAPLCASAYGLVTSDLDFVSGIGAMSLLTLGVITPMLALPLLVFHDRANDRWLWTALIVGGALAALAPIAVLVAGGDWSTQVWFAGRWGSGTTITLKGYLWLAGAPAALMTVGGTVGLVASVRHP